MKWAPIISSGSGAIGSSAGVAALAGESETASIRERVPNSSV